ncbi:hypothetical protein PV08_11375 [Exophiala spinifera]|uniref:YbhB/YbcL family Raf kinase inhibitor-like protein n=1 Tax=Exophiala spinifera TaxID=91928 RepID=A0A0D1ZBM9_9EURO|nr:uncharacterized protein PV08_11375 [Exophiala spinifera]KIW10412.1 hypothetical protein PV08_11375 [Exophiala spinifera]
MPDHPVHQAVLSLVKDDSKVLHLAFGSRKVLNGENVPKGDAKEAPTLTWARAPSDQKFVVVCLDLDAPFPSFAVLGPTLHWLQAGFTLDAATGHLTSPDAAIAFYAGPGPPPASGPHRYVFTLHEQPADFDARSFTKTRGYGIRDRMRYDFARFERDAKLGPPVAGTYFSSR